MGPRTGLLRLRARVLPGEARRTGRAVGVWCCCCCCIAI